MAETVSESGRKRQKVKKWFLTLSDKKNGLSEDK